VTYSKWRADLGGYELFEAGKNVPLGNDMPTPRLHASSPIGVSSITVGRSPSGALRRKGISPFPMGSIMPTRSSISLGNIADQARSPWVVFLVGALVGWGVALLRRK
jgi:hypothetical protein